MLQPSKALFINQLSLQIRLEMEIKKLETVFRLKSLLLN